MKSYNVILISFAFILFSCFDCTPSFKKTRTNDLLDRQRAIKFCETFYRNKKSNDFNKDSQYASALGAITKENLLKILTSCDSALGNFQSFDLVSLNSKVITEYGNESGTFNVVYICQYDKFKSRESFRLLMHDSIITIDGYHVHY